MRPQKEPYRCICGAKPIVVSSSPSFFVQCTRHLLKTTCLGGDCWQGPSRSRRRVAVLAWDRLMMSIPKKRPSTKRRDFEKGAK